jgi:sterol desaturase/sphingolipid hydroxylase (fatty acid hydroxylase superfamily)
VTGDLVDGFETGATAVHGAAKMTEEQFQIVRAVAFALAMVFAFALQRQLPHAPMRGSWRVNVGLWGINLAVLGGVCGACACTVSRWAAVHHLGLLHVLHVPPWFAWPITIVGLDSVSYLWHRANHRVAVLWRFHRVHHSDLSFTVSTGVRFHPGELLLSLPLRLTAIALLGAPVVAVVMFEALFTVANLVEHGNINFRPGLERWLARLLVTPALHRRHHTRRRPELDSNFGTIFTVWDRLLGTYGESSSALQIEVGLPGQQRALPLRTALTMPFVGVRD